MLHDQMPSQDGSARQLSCDTHVEHARGTHPSKEGEIGQSADVTLTPLADLETSSDNRGAAGQNLPDTQSAHASSDNIARIQELHRLHRGLQRAVTAMTLRIKADERWIAAARVMANGETIVGGKFPVPTDGDKLLVQFKSAPLFTVQDFIEAQRKAVQKEALKFVAELPVASWVHSVRGFGLPSLMAIVGEAGDLARFSNPGKLWKRFGLHVSNGAAPRKAVGTQLDYSPIRRAEMHVIGENLVRAGGPYADLIRARKEIEIAKAVAAGFAVLPANKITAKNKATSISQGQINKRALRYGEKRLLRDLWRAWHNAEGISASTDPHPNDPHRTDSNAAVHA